MMSADQLFNDSSTVGTTAAEIPDIFDVLEGGEDEGAVRYLLGFNGEEGSVGLLGQVDSFGGMEVIDKYVGDGISLPLNGTNFVQSVTATHQNAPTITVKSPVTVRQVTTSAANSKKRDTSGAKAIHNCDSCMKSFTTKFNLKRHINMHCHKSKENGVPIQGPPSASAPAKKNEKLKGERSPEPNEMSKNSVHVTNVTPQHQTVLAPNQTVIQRPSVVPVPYTRVVTVSQTEYQRTEPDSTYKLPSVQTILPVSVYTSSTTMGTTTYSTITSCDSSQPVPSVTSSSHNTDYGTLPADLFDPDSSQSQPPSPTSPPHAEEVILMVDKDNASALVADPNKAVAGTISAVQPVTLTTVPSGWTRKLSPETGRVIFISPLGKVFTCHDEIVQYFKGFHFSVPLGLFDFDPRYLEDSEEEEDDEDESDEDEDDDMEDEGEETSFCAKRRRSDLIVLESPGVAVAPGSTPFNSSLA
jgi:hypothetical protein